MPERDWTDALNPFREAWGALQGGAARNASGQEQGFWSQLEQLSTLPSAATQQAFASVRDWQVELVQETSSHVEQTRRQTSEFAQSLVQEARKAGMVAAAGKAARSVEQGAVRGAKSAIHGAEQVATQSIRTVGHALESTVDAVDAGFQQVGQIGHDVLATATRALADSPVGPPVARAARGAWGVLEDIDALVSELWGPADAPSPAQGAGPSASSQGKVGEQMAKGGVRSAVPAKRDAPDVQQKSTQDNTVLGQLGELVNELWQRGGGAVPAGERGPVSRQVPAPAVRDAESVQRDPLAPVLTPSFSDRQRAPVAGERGQQAAAPSSSAGNAQGSSGARMASESGAAISEDEWLERLNRALIEQAWMRGVDLT